MSTGLLFSEGVGPEQQLAALGKYDDPSGGSQWGWRTETEVIDADHVLLTAYNILPDGFEAKGTETKYSRVAQ